MINTAVSQLLNEMADLLELKGDNPFRIRAFRRAAETVEGLAADFGQLSRAERLDIPGIGKGIADLVEEFQAHGLVKEHQQLKKQFPEGVLQMMRLAGLGPKRAAHLFKELKIDSLLKLRKAAEEQRLELLRGFGPKLQQSLLKNLAFVEQSSQRVLLLDAWRVANDLKDRLRRLPGVEQVEIAGSLRRWKETIGDVDLLCSSKNPERTISDFLKISERSQVLASGPTKASVILPGGLQCDIRVMEDSCFGAAWLYFTGSKEHNIRLRELAQSQGLTLNEYGLFKNSDKKQKKPLAARTEEDVYKKLGLPWIPPELRENNGEIEAGLAGRLPRLVTAADVKGDFHNHTLLSDGENTLDDMVQAAQRKGWDWFFSADHSPSLKIANGLPVEILRQKMKLVRTLNESSESIRVFCSSEVDILGDGSLDYPNDVLGDLDCVVASVHTRFQMNVDEMTERVCRALENPHTDILGHISGRLLHRREGYALDMDRIFDTAKATQTAIEINGQPDRLELKDVHVKQAIERGVPLALNTDAHSIRQLEHMTLALHVARRGWAEPRHLLNCLSTDEILNWLS